MLDKYYEFKSTFQQLELNQNSFPSIHSNNGCVNEDYRSRHPQGTADKSIQTHHTAPTQLRRAKPAGLARHRAAPRQAPHISAHLGRDVWPVHQFASQASPALPPRTPVETLRTAGVCGAVLTALLPTVICSLEPAGPRP